VLLRHQTFPALRPSDRCATIEHSGSNQTVAGAIEKDCPASQRSRERRARTDSWLESDFVKTPVVLAALALLWPALAGAAAEPPQREAPRPAQTAPGDDVDRKADAYYNFTIGHYYQRRYEVTRNSRDAAQAIESFKRAYALDPSSQAIGEELAELYFQSQRIRDAVLEAQAILAKDPDNLAARRLLARIYVRTLGELNENSTQRETVVRAIEQYREILRLDPGDGDAALWLARLYRFQNDNPKAEATLRGLLAQDPDNAKAAEQLMQLLLDQGKSEDAVSALKATLERSPTARLWSLLGDGYMQLGDFGNAEQAYRKAMEDQPNDSGHRRKLARTLLEAEKYPEALEQYQQLASMDPENPDYYLRQAEIYRDLRQLDKAEQSVLQAKQRAPGNLEVIYYESAIYQAQGRFQDAIRVLSDSVNGVKAQSEVNPSRRRTLAILYQQLGQTYREVSEYDAAVNAFEEMRRLGPEEDLRARVLIIDTHRLARDLPKALEASRSALETYPDDRSLRVTEALLYGENAQTEQAASKLQQLLNGSEADFEIQLDLAQVYQQGRRWSEAEQAVAAAQHLAQRPAQTQTVLFLRGAVLERQKKFEDAEKQFREILQANPRHAGALNYLGYMLADLGIRLEEASQLIERALAEDPVNPAYQDSLGWVFYKQDKLPEAEAMLQKAVSRDKHDPTILSHLGDVYAKAGKDELAQAQWEKSLDEWRRVLPGSLEPDKIAEIQEKVSALKRRLAQRKGAATPRP